MIVSLIVAMDNSRGIGKDNTLPWHISSDLRRFKRVTMGHHLIMGRITYESIGRALPGRTNIVVTRDLSYKAEGCLVVHSLGKAFQQVEMKGDEEVFVIGGEQVFEQVIDDADRIYLTEVDTEVDADVYFPEFEETEWQEVFTIHQYADNQDQYPSTFRLLVKMGSALDNLDYSRIITPT